MKQSATPNRLINEKSPYLLQHAYNPVNWFAWSEEAFEKARAEGKPVFLSIGYSTCHWCHVMERESFEDDEVAKELNDNYISIKVDKEERPDIDHIYMSFCQATTGAGGWPLSVFLNADKKPFYVGTYFPKRAKYGKAGFLDILEAIAEKWRDDPDGVDAAADSMTRMLNGLEATGETQAIRRQVTEIAYAYFLKSFDRRYGGFGNAPKFPTPHNLLFLLRDYRLNNRDDALMMVEKTLTQMYKGGIFDHIGYGFSRYSTDETWLAPHFEKMLYDNALLLMAYTETYQVTKKPLYKEVAQKIIAYVQRELTANEGGFFCAEDADSEGVEGRFYVWSKPEIMAVIGEEDGAVYCAHYDITPSGNFEGVSIPNLIQTDIDAIESAPALKDTLARLSQKLFAAREKRPHPYKDEKIRTSWNGLMIAALAMAGKVFGNPAYLDLAEQAMRFVETHLFRADGRLMSRYIHGDVEHLGFLEDYAYLLWGYTELYDATFNLAYLKSAVRLTEDVRRYFEDTKEGGFYLYGSDAEPLITRPKEVYDGALPSGNSVMAYVLLKLAKLTGDDAHEHLASGVFARFGGNINEAPMGYTMMLCAHLLSAYHTQEIVLAGSRDDPMLKQMVKSIRRRFLPFSLVLFNEEGGDLGSVNPFAGGQTKVEGKTTAYVCEHFACQTPVTDLEAFNALL